MVQSLTDASARMLFAELGTWFGPPPIEFGGQLIDARIRFREAVAARITIPPPLRADTQGDAARLLAIVGHYDRARELIPSHLHRAIDAAAYCHTTPELMAPAFRKSVRHYSTLRGNATARRREAIEKMAQLLRRAELGTGTVTSDEIREALAPWL